MLTFGFDLIHAFNLLCHSSCSEIEIVSVWNSFQLAISDRLTGLLKIISLTHRASKLLLKLAQNQNLLALAIGPGFFPALPCIDYTDEINLQNLDIEGYMLHFEPSSHEQPLGLCKLSCIIFIKIWYGTKVCIWVIQDQKYTPTPKKLWFWTTPLCYSGLWEAFAALPRTFYLIKGQWWAKKLNKLQGIQ